LSVRLFVAVHLAEPVRQKIRAALDDFPVANPPWRWIEADNWHVTLKFLGETADADLNRVLGALDTVAPRHAAFDLVLGPFGGFPNLRAPRVLFYDTAEGAAACAALARDVDAALFEAIGLAKEARPFHAHATVARVKDRLPGPIAARLAVVPPLTDAVTRVDGFALVESRLRRTGAEYATVKPFAFSRNG
jgi:2'-5' RNA ligase